MLNTPEFRATLPMMSSMLPANTQWFLSQFYEVTGDPDQVMAILAFVTRPVQGWGGRCGRVLPHR